MGLSVIGAGFGRTGTELLKLALEALGFGPCHHMAEVLNSPEQTALWHRAAAGQLPDWQEAYRGFISAVDWPTQYYWRELSAFYPAAKVVLTARSPESWYESFSKTILPVIGAGNNPDSFGVRIINQKIFGGRPEDKAHAIAVYEKNISEVRSEIPPERLLVYELGSGWQPLTSFLKAPIPDIPYPSTNSAEAFNARIQNR